MSVLRNASGDKLKANLKISEIYYRKNLRLFHFGIFRFTEDDFAN